MFHDVPIYFSMFHGATVRKIMDDIFSWKKQRISPEPWGPGFAATGKGGWRGQFLLNIPRDGSDHERQHTHMYSKPK